MRLISCPSCEFRGMCSVPRLEGLQQNIGNAVGEKLSPIGFGEKAFFGFGSLLTG